MRKALKWISISIGGIVALFVVALIIIPHFAGIQRYRPRVEKMIEDATGRPVKLDGEIRLVLFPWAGLRFSDLHIGNPTGFPQQDFLYIKSFALRVKLLPLLHREIEVTRLDIDKPTLTLVRNAAGTGNWENFGKEEASRPAVPAPSGAKSQSELPISGLTAKRISIKQGEIIRIDQATGSRKEFSDISLSLKNVSWVHPVDIAFSMKTDGKPISLKGKVGPLQKETGKTIFPLDLSAKAFDQLDMTIKGSLLNPTDKAQLDANIHVSPFSPRKLLAEIGHPTILPPSVLDNASFDAHIAGDAKNFALSEGKLDLDQSHATFSAAVKEAAIGPDVDFSFKLDQLDLDRYLPPSKTEQKAIQQVSTPARSQQGAAATTRDSLMKRIILKGTAEIGSLKVHGIKLENIQTNITGQNGIFRMDPLSMKLYRGELSGSASVDMTKAVPVIQTTVQGGGIQVEPLLRDTINKDVLTGTMQVQAALQMSSGGGDQVKRTLKGQGQIRLLDGAITKVNLGDLFTKVKYALGVEGIGGQSSGTAFSELYVPFTVGGGVLQTSGATLSSSVVRAVAVGSVNLVDDTINLRIEPKAVAGLKNLGIPGQPSVGLVPVLVHGTVSSPKFAPDLKGIIPTEAEARGEIKNLINTGRKPGEGVKSMEEKAKGFLRSLPLGR
jgi:AsmA protein